MKQHDTTEPTGSSEPSGLAAGRKPVREYLLAHPDRVRQVLLQEAGQGAPLPALLDIASLCRRNSVRYRVVGRDELDHAFPGNHQGVVAKIFSQGFVELDDLLAAAAQAPLPLLVALDQVQDPGNVGTLARTLYALGGAGLIVPKHGSAGLGPGAARSSAGALERLPVAAVVNLARALDDCEEAGFAILCAQRIPQAENAFAVTLPTPAVLVLGGEDAGIRPGVAKRCSRSLYIPFGRDFDSLNVAQAGAILIAQLARQAGTTGR
jgi:23S rRNA (guanosine2251-2'-O)-methyltransferase